MLLNNKKELTTDLSSDMGESKINYAKWKKSNSKNYVTTDRQRISCWKFGVMGEHVYKGTLGKILE